MARPKSIAPEGRLTLVQVAQVSGLSVQALYTRIATGTLKAEKTDGVLTLSTSQADEIHRLRVPGGAGQRRAVMTRVTEGRYQTWKAAASPKPVSTWLAELADREAKPSVVVLNHLVAFGHPVVRGTGIKIETIASMAAAGDSADWIARFYDLPVKVVQDALAWHQRHR